MPRLVLTTATIGVLMAFQANPGHAGELEEMRAMLLEMQQRLQQQQARIEQLERQQALPPATCAGDPAGIDGRRHPQRHPECAIGKPSGQQQRSNPRH